MIRDQTSDDRIRDWLEEEASGQLPDWVLTATFERTRAQRQRTAWSGWRNPSVSNPIRVLVVAALSLAAVLAIAYAGGQTPLPQRACPTPTPATSPAAAPSTSVGVSLVEFMWSATGPAGDPMNFLGVPGYPQGGHVAIDRTCRIWVADTMDCRFGIFHPDGTFESYWGSRGTRPGEFNLLCSRHDSYGDIAFAPDGTFYVLDVGNHRVQHFDQERRFLGQWVGSNLGADDPTEPVAIDVDADGYVYMLDINKGTVERHNSDGVLVDMFSTGLKSFGADDMKLDADGDVLISANIDNPNGIYHYSGGKLVGKIPLGEAGANQYNGMAVDGAGRVFVARGPASSGNKVEVYAPDGTLITGFGTAGTGEGQFGYGFSEGVALDGAGSLYIVDGAASRLEKFRLLPPLAP